MADIGDLVVRLTIGTSGARKEFFSTSQGFKQLNRRLHQERVNSGQEN